MKLTIVEIKRLEQLYKLANEYNDDYSWNNVDVYFKKLSDKYQFNPELFIITGKGIIEPISRCNKCGDVANTYDGVNYEKVKVNYKLVSLPICFSCKARFYNGK